MITIGEHVNSMPKITQQVLTQAIAEAVKIMLEWDERTAEVFINHQITPQEKAIIKKLFDSGIRTFDQQTMYFVTQRVLASEIVPEVEAHSVRWALGKCDNEFVYGKWHYTTDAQFTLCGVCIPLATGYGTFLPDTDDNPNKITCKKCLKQYRKLTNNEYALG
jgi:hypothetical protein